MKAGAIAADNLDAAETAVATGEEARKAAEFAVARAEYKLRAGTRAFASADCLPAVPWKSWRRSAA